MVTNNMTTAEKELFDDSVLGILRKCQGDWDKVTQYFQSKGNVIFADLKKESEKLKKACASQGINIATLIDKNYPQAFKTNSHPPYAIFYKGDINLLDSSYDRTGIIGWGNDINEYTKRVITHIGLNVSKKDKGVLISSDASASGDYGQQVAQTIKETNNKDLNIYIIRDSFGSAFTNHELINKIVSSGGLVISFMPTGIAGSTPKERVEEAIISLAQKVIITNMGLNPDCLDYVDNIAGREAEKVRAVVHDFTLTEADNNNKVIDKLGIMPYLGGE